MIEDIEIKTIENLLQLIGNKEIKVKNNGILYQFNSIEIFNTKLGDLITMIKNKKLYY